MSNQSLKFMNLKKINFILPIKMRDL